LEAGEIGHPDYLGEFVHICFDRLDQIGGFACPKPEKAERISSPKRLDNHSFH
jgi:hypothetical protein